MTHPDRISSLDASFLHLEDHTPVRMHVATVMVFEGVPPTPEEMLAHIEADPETRRLLDAALESKRAQGAGTR